LSERNFGVEKRNDTQHRFLVGSGNGLLEVYFGPTDQPRELLLQEVGQSETRVVFAHPAVYGHGAGARLDRLDQSSTEYNLVGLFHDFERLATRAKTRSTMPFTAW